MSSAVTRRHWADRHTVVTGGTSGIGLEVTHQIRAVGGRVTALGLADAAAAALREQQDESLRVVTADVTDRAALDLGLEEARAQHGPVGALVTCAGVGIPGYFFELPDREFRRHMDVNYFGTLNAVRAVLPDLLARGGSSITCISSAAGFVGVFGYGAYSPSKFAVAGLCQVLRQELKPQGVSVTAVFPPDVDTPMLAHETPLKPPELRALSSGNNALSPASVARAMLSGTAAGRASVVPGASTRGLRLLAGATPRLTAALMDRIIAGASLKGRP